MRQMIGPAVSGERPMADAAYNRLFSWYVSAPMDGAPEWVAVALLAEVSVASDVW